MKKYFLLLILIPWGAWSMAQENQAEPKKNERRFFIGASYSYITMEMELRAMSLHSVWYGNDFGSYDLTGDEISAVNDHIDRESRVQVILASIGWRIIHNPETQWHLEGSVMAGIADNVTTVSNKSTGSRELKFNSGLSKPCLGFSFDFGYHFTPEWSLSMRPYLIGTMGKSSSVSDDLYPDPVNFLVEKEHTYRTLLGKVSLLAGFRAGPVSMYAGPGIYGIRSWHDYKRQYSEGDPGEVITEEMSSTLRPVSIIYGAVGAEWDITPMWTVKADADLGKDILISGGFQFNF